jgi:hypothetical protein
VHEPVQVDTHVHLHYVFDLAVRAAEVAQRSNGPFVALLAEIHGHHLYAALRSVAERTPASPAPPAHRQRPRLPEGYVLEPTAEPVSLSVRPREGGHPPTYLVAGRQLVSVEGVEVLALGLDPDHPLVQDPDRTRSAGELVAMVRAAGAAAVLPWSFGKWVGRRGRVVTEVATEAELATDPLFFLGDIPARCWPWPTPGVFRGASRVLAGTDPLPLPGREKGVGRYRMELEGPIQPDEPWAWLLDRFRSGAAITVRGRRDRLVPSIRDQIALRRRRGP